MLPNNTSTSTDVDVLFGSVAGDKVLYPTVGDMSYATVGDMSYPIVGAMSHPKAGDVLYIPAGIVSYTAGGIKSQKSTGGPHDLDFSSTHSSE